MADRLHVKAGDEVFAVETENGILLTPFDPTFERAMSTYERTAAKYRNALRDWRSRASWTSRPGSRGPCSRRCTPIRSEPMVDSLGLRDEGLLESALARPRHAWAYREEEVDLPAAEYAFGLIKNHAFLDGNKRIGFVAANVFLLLNGFEIEAGEPEAVDAVLRVADGRLDKDGLAAWIRSSIRTFEEQGKQREAPRPISRPGGFAFPPSAPPRNRT